MKLSDREITDITQILEAGKPLPDRYRFLLFEGKREVELVWNEKNNQVCNITLPFQTIEHVDEPRFEEDKSLQGSLFDPITGRQLKGWSNKLIWGDNKLILSSLKNGPLREEIERQGGLKLIYIDPPFDVGADFSMDIEIGGGTFTKKPNVLEELAYRDTWGKGADSFITMIYERLALMRDLLAEDGSIYVHCDWRVNSYIRLVMDEVFGKENFRNEIIWCYKTSLRVSDNSFGKDHDSVLFYGKSRRHKIEPDKNDFPPSQSTIKRWAKYADKDGFVSNIHFAGSGSTIIDTQDSAKGFNINHGIPRDWWEISSNVSKGNTKEVDAGKYPTQKPEALLERIIKASSNEGDLVADFFCGSGTLAAAAEKLGRKWICTDLGKFAIHTTRKRMIGVQRQLKTDGKQYRAFEVLNLGKYERQYYIGVSEAFDKQKNKKQKEKDYISLILKAYSAEAISNNTVFHGKKLGRLVVIGPINLPVSRLFVQKVIEECSRSKITKADLLGFEFEMGLFPQLLDEAKSKGIDLATKYIPKDVFDKRAVEKNQVTFHDVSYVEVKIHTQKGKVSVELKDFSVYYSQDSIAQTIEIMKKNSSKIILSSGKILKISKDKNNNEKKEILTKKWADWIDYWSVDFDFESKKEIIRIKSSETGQFEEKETGDYIFENEWQSFRTKKNRNLELKSPFYEVNKSSTKVAVKVIDIFGNDTMKIVEVKVK